MYSEFDVSFFGMSTPQLSQSHKDSKIHLRSSYPSPIRTLKPILEIPDELENTKKRAVVDMEQKLEDVPTFPPSSSSSSSSDNQTNKEEEKQGEAAAAKDDDGYQTPTSPRHRIPPAIECPLAPKKPTMPKRWHCIRTKAGAGRVRRRIEIESALCPDTDDLDQRKKKARGDATASP
ncbi:hypothetical protein COCNU_04G015270 [Cocos nucifera]|uniref:Uncharacterized protein n=1 Tax=Cocos nucifera TaxID=13894 RepID=A0A8K0I7A9_COCNU|nr:hypothetical protein COCNU_04G015270 [Cocos nucifera]